MKFSYRLDSMDTDSFEKFAVELVRRKFDIEAFRGFAPGKDDGIDGIDDIKSPTLILQAKRWSLSKNHSTAVNELKREIDNIVKNIEKYGWKSKFKYVIVTSLRLSPKRCKDIRDYADERYPGLIPSDDYIIYSSHIEILSNDKKYIDIFKKYHLDENNLSSILKEEKLRPVEKESSHYFADYNYKFFAETNFLEEAYYKIQENRVLLIQGPPGIGKTTTCMILGNLLRSNKEIKFDAIMRKITDIDKVIDIYYSSYSEEDKALFVVFDDFLGRNKFDVGDHYLPDLKRIYATAKRSNNLYICLNSRTQIIKDAKNLNSNFKRLIQSEFKEEEISVLDLSNYSKTDKAFIFRKSFERKIDEINDKKELAERYNSLIGCDWSVIIGHKNFYPRVIELIVNNFQESDKNFHKYVIDSLKNPFDLYENIFHSLNIEEKYLLFVILLFDSYPVQKKYITRSFHRLEINPAFDIEKAIYKLEDSWILPMKDYIYGEVKINFLNPSIIDFLNYKKKILPNMLKNIEKSSIYLSQVFSYYGKSIYNEKFMKKLLYEWHDFEDNKDFIGEKIISIIKLNRWEQYKSEIRGLLLSFKEETSHSSKVTWTNIIDNIYKYGNFELKKEFLLLLEEEYLSDNILESRLIDSYDIDKTADQIDSIINEVNDELYDEYGFPNFFESNYYEDFKNKKVDILQDYIDNDVTIIDIQRYEIDVENIEEEVEIHVKQVSEDVENQITESFEWKGINKETLDYEILRSFIKETILEELNIFNRKYYRNEVETNNISEFKTVESILNQPLKYK